MYFKALQFQTKNRSENLRDISYCTAYSKFYILYNPAHRPHEADPIQTGRRFCLPVMVCFIINFHLCSVVDAIDNEAYSSLW